MGKNLNMENDILQKIDRFEKVRSDFKEVYFEKNLSDTEYDGQFIVQMDKVLIFFNLNHYKGTGQNPITKSH